VTTVEHMELFYGRHHDLGNRFIMSISLMTTDMFYGRHHVLVKHYIIYISLMTTDMLYGRHRYYVTITQVMVTTVEHIRGP
jgi:hypothetical protein